jgi:hypothetical protein
VFFFLLLWAGVAGFLASLSLRHLGITHMGLRYVLAVAIAYGVFLLLLWLWLRFRSDPADAPDLSGLGTGPKPGPCSSEVPPLRPGGGQFGGGGASDGIDRSAAAESLLSAKTESAGGVAEVAAGAGEGCGVVILAGLALAALLVWVLSVAPVLLAEIVLDSLLLAALYRRWRRSDEPYRLQAAWRHTRNPFLLVSAVIGIFGTLLQWYAPHATTLGAIWQQAK